MITDDNETGSRERCAQRLAIGCLGAVLVTSAACTNTTLDIFNPDLGLLARWPPDESQPGSMAVDASGFGNHGYPSSSPPVPALEVPPVHFQDRFSLSFNGQDQRIEIRNPPLLNLGGPIKSSYAHASPQVEDTVPSRGIRGRFPSRWLAFRACPRRW